MECNALTNSQYSRWETIKLNAVPAEIHEDVLEESICKALSLTEVKIVPEDLQACHRMKRSDQGGLNKKEIQLNLCNMFSILICNKHYLFV